MTVYPNSPAKRAGLREGDVIIRANGRSLAGLSEEAGSALIKGPEGTFVTLTIRRGTRTFTRRIKRERIEVPVVTSKIANAGGTRVAYVSLASFGPRNASTQVAAAIRRLKRRGAKGIVFDLRDNGGGLVTQAQLIASMFLPDGKIVTTRGRAVKEQTLFAVGQPIAGKLPTVVLVDRDTASASEIVAGALQDRKRAKLVGERTFGKGVFQEIMPLDNGGALDITVGQYFLPSGRNLGGPGTKPGQGLKPDVAVKEDTKTTGRRGARARPRRPGQGAVSRRQGGSPRRKPPYEDALGGGKPRSAKVTTKGGGKAKPKGAKAAAAAAKGAPRRMKAADARPPKDGARAARPERSTSAPPPAARTRSPPLEPRPAEGIVATVDKRGRFLVAEPFFERGGRMVLERDSRVTVGDLVLVRPASRAGGHAKLVRTLGRPDVASDVLEALMLDRGLRRRFDPAVERAAKQARDHGVDREVARRDLTALTTFTIDPATARDFDDAISAERIDERRTRIWVHIADVSAYVKPGSLVDREAARRGTSVYVPGRVEPMLPEPLSNDACSLVPLQRRAAVTVELEYEGTDVVRAQFYRSTIRSDARLDYEQVDRVFAGDEPGARAVGDAAGGGPRGCRRAARAAHEPGRAGDRDERAGVRLRRRRPHRRGAAERADRVAPAHRAPHDRRQRAGGQAAVRPRRAVAVPRAREARRGERAAARRAARVARRRDAAGARAHDAVRRPPRSSRPARARSRSTPRAPATAATR